MLLIFPLKYLIFFLFFTFATKMRIFLMQRNDKRLDFSSRLIRKESWSKKDFKMTMKKKKA